jgi:hypothetical protein
MKRTFLALAACIPLLIGGCASYSTNSQVAAGVDFTKFSTFQQASPPTDRIEGLPGYSEITANEIQSAIGSNLEGKGFRNVLEGDAQLLVAFTVGGEPRTDVWGTSGWGWYGSTDVQTTHYVQGELTINVYDARQKKLIWHGWATAALYGNDAGGGGDARKVVDAILKKFPPQ